MQGIIFTKISIYISGKLITSQIDNIKRDPVLHLDFRGLQLCP
jgi:hypothetical protein